MSEGLHSNPKKNRGNLKIEALHVTKHLQHNDKLMTTIPDLGQAHEIWWVKLVK